MIVFLKVFVFVVFEVLRPSQHLWSCRDGQLTLPHFFPGQARLSR